MREEWKTENPNINYVRFDMANVGGEATGQRLEVGSTKTLKNGNKKQVVEKTFIAHEYCPWCGKKYNYN